MIFSYLNILTFETVWAMKFLIFAKSPASHCVTFIYDKSSDAVEYKMCAIVEGTENVLFPKLSIHF